jgi:phosphatidylethanolamine/phosphatidyl-N-methylethanolamine N-methyltransferase
VSETLLFLRQLLTRPREVSAIAPSSRGLGRAMARGLGPESGRVVEFGPGTGRLTEAILATGVRPENLTLIEMNAEFAMHLRGRFTGVRVIEGGAETAAEHMAGGVATVVSGLPLLSMPVTVRKAIVGAAFEVLAPSGRYVQFTYGPKPPLPETEMHELSLTVERGEKVWLNLPPATVYRFTRA